MSKLPRPSISRKSIMQPSVSRQSTSRASTSRPSTSRPSTSRLSVFARPSSIGVGGPKIDVKANIKKNIVEIVKYLMDKEYPTTITKKNLMNPTEATFKSLLKFIIQDFYPDFECTRVAQSVMDLMVDFEYPYPLKESHFKPVGSPHSWPYLLEVLNWLCGMARNMEYELNHVSQLYTLNCTDEEDADEELRHQLLMSKYYRLSVNNEENGIDYPVLKERYLQELDINGTVTRLKEENLKLQEEIDTVKEKNQKHPEEEAKYIQHISEVNEEIDVCEADKKAFNELLSKIKDDIEALQNQSNIKTEQLDVLKEEGDKENIEIGRLEAAIMSQPPQHEVQKIKQYYSDILDKKVNLEVESKAIADDNAMREVVHYKHSRELKERMRKLISEIREQFPEINYDCGKAIDNKSIIQATAIIEKLKKKIHDDKEESKELEIKRFDMKMEVQRLEDDLRLNKEKLHHTKANLEQKENSRLLTRKECIAKSEKMSEQLEETKRSISELEAELRASESPEAIECKIREEEEATRQLAAKIQIYKEISKHRCDETFFRYRDLSYLHEFSLLLAAEAGGVVLKNIIY